ncbi:MAG: type I-B CRISPR-associated endonuclease Cas1b [Ignavibacteria bacterium]|nr:type I-B CRISPR-associated endonuclease Cas1b [Ignavibacteria bacterium]
MKNNIYIFSNSILSRKNNTFKIEKMSDVEAIHEIDIFESEQENVILPSPKFEGNGQSKYLPAETIEAFFTFGEIRFNSQFFKCLSYYSIPLHMFNYYGNYIGSFIPVDSEGDGSIQLLQSQFYFDYQKRLYISKKIIEAALRNILDNLNTYLYEGIELEEQIELINHFLDQVRLSTSIDELKGYEGNARNIYYQSFNDIIKGKSNFEKRIKNPPIGLINTLISFGNSILYAVCISEIYRTRLNPYIGFIHEGGNKKHSLAYDISEIFKPIIVDKVIFRLLNLNMISEKDCKIKDDYYYLNDNAKQKFVEEFEKRLSTVITHKRLNRKISYRSLIRMEGFNLINFMTGKIKSYEPYYSA